MHPTYTIHVQKEPLIHWLGIATYRSISPKSLIIPTVKLQVYILFIVAYSSIKRLTDRQWDTAANMHGG